MADECFSFLITTDNHMGYRESDHIRRKDSYMAFNEALKIARQRQVDFILLGGDLFHVNRPSATVEHKCIKIIRQHMSHDCDRATTFKRVSGEFSHFAKLNHANFEDPHLRVPYPILTIHGNHDDPTGTNAQSVCEKLATCGLLNYFGAVSTKTKTYQVKPIILQKGALKIALYGMGYIPDMKLKLAFDKGDVVFVAPPKDSYNILVVHQNRIPFNKNAYVPDELFPTFFHLVVRGHEHTALKPEPIPESSVKGLVYQPGSTVATSISSLEAGPKSVGLFKIKIQNPRAFADELFKVDYEIINLRYVRKMLLKDISQKEIINRIKEESGSRKVSVMDYKAHCSAYVQEMIDKLKKTTSQSKSLPSSRGNSDDGKLSRLELPIVRIRLEYVAKNERFDSSDLVSRLYPTSVANKDIVTFKKQKLEISEADKTEKNITFSDNLYDEDEEEFEHIDLSEERRDTIDVMIEDYFKDKPEDQRLKAFSLEEYTNAIRGSSEDGNVISKILSEKKRRALGLFSMNTGDEDHSVKYHDENILRQLFLVYFRTLDPNFDEKKSVKNAKGFDAKGDVIHDSTESDDDVIICT